MSGLTLKSESGNFLIRGQKISSNQSRDVNISQVEEKETGILEFSISSDEPYERWFGTEILSHKDNAVNLVRLNNHANILYNHHRDDYIAVCVKGWIQNGKTRVRTLWNLDNPDYSLPRRIYTDVAAEILKNSSVGYSYDELLFEEKDGQDIITATRWTPFEGSIVTVPADYTVGVGRQYFDLAKNLGNSVAKASNWEELNQKVDRVVESVDKILSGEKDMGDENSTTLEVTREEDINKERERSEAIFAAGEKFNCPQLARQALKEGWSVEQLRSQILLNQQEQQPVARTTAPLGMSETEQKRYSFQKAIQVALGKEGFKENCFEKEIHDELVKRAKASRNYKESENVLIPVYDLGVNKRNVQMGWEEISRSAALRNYFETLYQQRDLQVGNPIFGGNLVETELLSERFIDIFRNRSILRQMGMQSLTGLVGNIDIPKQTAGAIDGNYVYWVAEDADVGQIDAEFGLVEFRPKNVGSFMYVTRSMLLHSSIGMDNFIRRELAIALALGMDRAGLVGTGTNNEPLGIFNTPGVNVVTFGTDGGFPTWQKLVQFETKVAVANADERTMGWIMNARTRGELKSRPKFENTSNETLWQSANVATNQGYVAGYRAGVSNQVPGNLTKGTGTNLSATALGDWSRLVCAEWGTYELAADPYHKFLAGGVRVRIIHTCDIQVLQEKAFSVATDLSTPYSDAA